MRLLLAVLRQHGFKILLLLALLYFGGGYIYERFIKSDEAKIRDGLRASAQGVRDRIAGDITQILARDFKGPHGVDKDLAHSICVNIVMTHRVLEAEILPEPVEVKVSSDRTKATARFQIVVRGKIEQGYEWRTIGPEYSQETGKWMKADFEKTDDGWRITRLKVEGEE